MRRLPPGSRRYLGDDGALGVGLVAVTEATAPLMTVATATTTGIGVGIGSDRAA
jgi:hypothetical protein